MDTERPPKSYFGAVGATVAALGVVLVLSVLAVPVLFLAYLGGASFAAVAVMAGAVVFAAVALWAALYALSRGAR